MPSSSIRLVHPPLPFVLGIAVVLLALVLPGSARETPTVPASPEVRGMWVTRSWMTSPQQVAQVVDDAARHGVTTLFVQVRGRGDAFYLGGPEPRAVLLARQPAFDPLAAIIERAHARGLQVHAWVNVNLVSGSTDLPRAAQHVIHRHPELLMVPRDLVPALHGLSPTAPSYVSRLAAWSRRHVSRIEGLYVSPVTDDGHAYTLGVIDHLIRTYPLDGLHLDYIRYPGPEFDHSRAALRAFRDAVALDLTPDELSRLDTRAATNPLAFVDFFPQRWSTFRRDRLTALLTKVRSTLREARPNAMLTTAVWPDADDALGRKMQDWPGWIREGRVDAVLPMMYTTSAATFARQLGVLAEQPAGTVWPGLGVYRITADEAARRVQAVRRLGFSGVVLFSYDSMSGGAGRPSPYLTSLQRQVFQAAPVATGASAR